MKPRSSGLYQGDVETTIAFKLVPGTPKERGTGCSFDLVKNSSEIGQRTSTHALTVMLPVPTYERRP